jgi:MFS family permease
VIDIKELLQNRRYIAFWLSQVASRFGNGLTLVALAAQVIPSRGASQYGVVLAFEAAAMSVMMLSGGVLADRYSRTFVMAVSDMACGAGVAGYLVFGGGGPFWVLLLSAIFVGSGVGLYEPAHRAALPQLVPEAHRQLANSIDSGTKRLATAAGAGVGGLIIAIANAQIAYGIDLATFAFSAVSLVLVNLPPVSVSKSEDPQPHLPYWAEVRAGFREVVRRPWVAAIMIQGTVQMFLVFAPAFALIPVVAASHYGPSAFGVLSAAQFVGSMLGSALGAILKPRRPGVLGMHALAFSAPVPLCLAFPPTLPVFVAISVVAWAGISVFMVFWYTALQNHVPEKYQGRVFSLEAIASFGLEPVALALAPTVAVHVGFESVGVTGAVVLILSTYAVLLVPKVGSFGSTGHPEAAQTPGRSKPKASE